MDDVLTGMMGWMMLDLRDLARFVALAEERHFGRAAARLGMGQPQLSRTLQRLERVVGTPLLSRRGAAPTEAGASFLADARRLLALAAEAPEAARRAARGETGRLALGFSPSCAYAFLPRAVEGFRRARPEVEIALHDMPLDRQEEALREGAVDLCLMRAAALPRGLTGAMVFEEPFVAALPRAHRLSGRSRVAPRDLAEDAFVSFPPDRRTGFRDLLLRICAEAGFAPRVAQEVSPMHALVGLVAAGVGVAFVPASVRTLRFAGIAYRPLGEVEVRSPVWAAWRPDRLPAPARAFAAHLGALAE